MVWLVAYTVAGFGCLVVWLYDYDMGCLLGCCLVWLDLFVASLLCCVFAWLLVRLAAWLQLCQCEGCFVRALSH